MVREGLLRRYQSTNEPCEGVKSVMTMSREVFQAEGIASANALKQEKA